MAKRSSNVSTIKKNVIEEKPNTSALSLNIEELKGTTITINGDSAKSLVVFEKDINFVSDVEDLYSYIKTLSTKFQEEQEDIENISEDEQQEYVDKKVDELKNISKTISDKFNKVFKDETAFERVFGKVMDIGLVILVVQRVLDLVYNLRKDEINKVREYTKSYKK